MFSPGHLGPTQTPVQPKEQGLPGVSGAGGGGGGAGAGATSCLAAIHSVILGMMGPLESGKRKEHEGGLSLMIVPDTVLTLGEFPIAVSEENTLPVLLLALLEVGEGGAALGGVAELLALVGTCQHHQ